MQTTVQDLKFVKTVGTGSYGEVDLMVHKKLGVQLAVKKIDKSSLANKKIKATLMREVEIHK